MEASVFNALQKLAKWRSIFAAWQLGTRPKGDPESDAVRDHREISMLLRVELNALTKVLIDKKIITMEEWEKTLKDEAVELDKSYERRFPGFRTFLGGVEIYDPPTAAKTTKGWRP